MRIVGTFLRFVIITSTLVCSVALAEKAQPGSWDRSAAQALADELAIAATRLVIECRKAPPNYSDIDAGEHLGFRYHARHFRSVAVSLSNAIEDDKGYLGTRPIFNELGDISGDLKRYAIDNPRGAGKKVEDAVKVVEGVLSEMGVLYEKQTDFKK